MKNVTTSERSARPNPVDNKFEYTPEKAGEYVVMVCAFSDLPGDADNDGVLNVLDASVILKRLVGILA